MARPLVSFVIPTLNADKVLENCLNSINYQNYPNESVEIIVADGGSTDETLAIARKYGAMIVSNPLKTAEAGKAVGVRKANGEFIALVDSDNILPSREWLNEMINPLIHLTTAVGSEPWEYTWRKEDGFITRYCALMGMNDPLVYFLGNYDRKNILSGKWTEVPLEQKDFGKYLLVTLRGDFLPTIGANGTVFRADFLKKHTTNDYLFDIDILARGVKRTGSLHFVKVKNGIIHSYCESSVPKFSRKQRRRARDYFFYKSKGERDYNWRSEKNSLTKGLLYFVLSCLLFFPLLIQTIRGYFKKRDLAWFFHPLACWITLWEYGTSVIISLFKKEELNRLDWKQ